MFSSSNKRENSALYLGNDLHFPLHRNQDKINNWIVHGFIRLCEGGIIPTPRSVKARHWPAKPVSRDRGDVFYFMYNVAPYSIKILTFDASVKKTSVIHVHRYTVSAWCFRWQPILNSTLKKHLSNYTFSESVF